MLLNRDLVAELPFILMHPKPDDIDENILINEATSPNKNNSHGQNSQADKQNTDNNNPDTKDDAPNLIQLEG